MSLWHSPQSAESIKKSDGIRPPVLVLAAEGQNGDLGPAPSPSIDAGTTSGLRIRSAGLPNRIAAAQTASRISAARQRVLGSIAASAIAARRMCPHNAQ